ncbi:hypothetical protein [Brenneria tiliae]|uniref:Phage tail protein n=1 Tax=Brenneria tiliae TaxID=2914984 RepID=A0ABT0MSD0_9GAMM|nr:hypothetical protein [Brenneria tiliae]MCL2892462.1 hypothetical protein [Brenneria tiliae]
MSWYRIGTITATNGSKIITGAGTAWTNPLNGVSAGRMLLLPAAGTVQLYEIASVQSDTQLTLVDNFTGTTGAGKAYAIPTSPSVSIEQFAHEFAATLAYYQQQLQGWQSILTGSGDVTLTAPDGQVVTVKSQSAIAAAVNDAMKKSANLSDLADAAESRANLGLGDSSISRYRGALGTTDLNTLTGSSAGFWRQVLTGNATLARNYPVTQAGLLTIETSIAGSAETCMQTYKPYNSAFKYYRIYNGNTWTNWFTDWSTGNLPNPMTLDTNQVVTSYKIVSYDGAGVILRPATTGAACFIRGQTEAGVNTWWVGRGSNTTQDATFLNNIGGAYIRLLANGNIELNTSNTVTINGVAILKTGDYGLGGIVASSSNFSTIPANPVGQWFKSAASNTGFPTSDVAWCGLTLPYDINAGSAFAILAATQLSAVRMQVHVRRNAGNLGWLNVLLSNQYTVDANGFYKSASPIIRLANSAENMTGDFLDGFTAAGVGAVNDEAGGVTAERLDTGVYLITGALGLAESGWTIEIPQDVNGNRLVFVTTETAENGNITVLVSRRKFDVETGNVIAGDAMNIPAGRWIDMRLSMPAAAEPVQFAIDESTDTSADVASVATDMESSAAESEPGI